MEATPSSDQGKNEHGPRVLKTPRSEHQYRYPGCILHKGTIYLFIQNIEAKGSGLLVKSWKNRREPSPV